jgi:hypothetical protein
MSEPAQAGSVSILHSVVASMRPHPTALSRYRDRAPSTRVSASVPDPRVK